MILPAFVQSPLLLSASGFFHAFPGIDPVGRSYGEMTRDVFCIPPDSVSTLSQVHSADVLVADGRDAGMTRDGKREGDGIVSIGVGRGAAVFTADCVPILLVVPGTEMCAAVHAGWRGLASGIVANAVEVLARAGGESVRGGILAAVGTSAKGCCYEVDDAVAEAMRALPGASRAVVPGRSSGKWMVDLQAVALAQLGAAGVPSSHAEGVGPCTICSCDFHSFRRDGAKAGRQASFVFKV